MLASAVFESVHDLALFVGYLVGSFPSGFIVARFCGVKDIRKEGSGNVGATNVARTCGLGSGIAVFAMDVVKPLLALLVLYSLRGDVLFDQGPLDFAIASLGVILGQCFPVWLGFRGGKGMACYIGFWWVFDPFALALSATILVALIVVTRRAFISSCINAIFVLLFHIFVTAGGVIDKPQVLAIIMLTIVLIQHRNNIISVLRNTKESSSSRSLASLWRPPG